jgi:hypothetical protein
VEQTPAGWCRVRYRVWISDKGGPNGGDLVVTRFRKGNGDAPRRRLYGRTDAVRRGDRRGKRRAPLRGATGQAARSYRRLRNLTILR